MRIVVASPPKAGNHWVKCLLAETYGLRVIVGDEKGALTLGQFAWWHPSGPFKDGSIFHVHFNFSPQVCDLIEALPAKIVTILRDPYDAFVSICHRQQRRAERSLDKCRRRPRQTMTGRAIGHPEVIAYLRGGFGSTLKQGVGWLSSGRSLVVRYEDLHRDAAGTLAILAAGIAPASPERLAAAVERCRAGAMRERDPRMQWHIRSAHPGGGSEELGPEHLAAFRDVHAEAIRALGYKVR